MKKIFYLPSRALYEDLGGIMGLDRDQHLIEFYENDEGFSHNEALVIVEYIRSKYDTRDQ
jgi:hypothetical protein